VLDTIPNLQPHEVFGFAPYWSLAEEPGFDLQDLSTVDYFSLDVNGDGTVAESGPGWVGYESQDLVNLVNRAHASDDRVVLTVTCFDQPVLDQLASNPGPAAANLSSQLTGLLSAKSLDGVNIDFEGNGPQDRSGLDSFVGGLSSQLRAADPHWQITMDTYASSAADPGGFYDVAGLAPSVDGFFVMAYDMEDPSAPSATAPLIGPASSDTSALNEYEAVVSSTKVILGVPAYGYDWPTAGPGLGAPATGAPTPVAYSQIAAMGTPVYWDPSSETPWTSYQSGTQWHQVFFDNPTSIALKAHLAEAMHAAGVGMWALGMDGNSPAMAQALLGSAQAVKYQTGPGQSSAPPATSAPAPGPTTTSAGQSSGTTTASYQYSGTWNGHAEALQPVAPSSLPGGGKGQSAGQLTGFQTDDPTAACLSRAAGLPVTELSANPTYYVVSVAKPQYCATGTWMFNAPASPPPSSTTTTSPLSGLVHGL